MAPDLRLLRTRLAYVLSGLTVLLLLAFVPPLINVSRFQRRIASNLSESLGRPVHVDRVSLTLLPLPGFTLENFVVSEDPSFGYEPILRANEVRVTVRISSLWTHHVEFSRISLTDPTSLNLVRLPDGRWNFESVLLQASRIEAAPTAQTNPGRVPRFPYIEASGARINLKLGQEKMPLALTDSEFALWLPTARQWRFRLQAHPARSDVAPADAGVLRLEGALGDGSTRAATLGQVPIDLRTVWEAAPLAGLGRIAFGHDIGMRGDLTLDVRALGTVDYARVSAGLKLAHARRADFVPPRLVALETACTADASGRFQSWTAIMCRWPAAPAASQSGLLLTASIPQISALSTASANLEISRVPLSVLLGWVQAATSRPPTALTGSGLLAGTLTWKPQATPAWTGTVELSGESLNLPHSTGTTPLTGMTLTTATPNTPDHTRAKLAALNRSGTEPASGPSFDLGPASIPLGGRQPAVLDGHFDVSGYTLHLAGPVLPSCLRSFAESFPQFGEGLSDLFRSDTTAAYSTAAEPETAVHVDLFANRRWGQAQTWSDSSGTVLAARH